MQNVILVVHLLLALSLIAVVLLQRSEGGGLGMGSGGGGAMSARSAGTALGKLTWALAVAFIATSLTLTILAARDSSTGSVLDRLSPAPASSGEAPADDGLDTDGLLPPPSAGSGGSDGDGPIVPQAD